MRAGAGASPLGPREFRVAIAAVLMTILLGALDQTIVGVAVPTIARQIGGFEWMAWVISAYLIASTVVTPLYGRLSDRVGRRRVMTIAILIFLAGSVLCALARSMPQLVLARVVQGAGGGGLLAMAQSVVADIVPLRNRGRYQSYISVVWALASLLGPVAGGVLTEFLSWPWIFWINLPVGLLALLLVHVGLAGLPVMPQALPRSRIDGLGALLLVGGLTALLIPMTRVGQGAPWRDLGNLLGWALAVLLLVVFVVQQRRHPDPVVPIRLLAEPAVVACCGLMFVCFFNFIALTVLVPLRLQLVAGVSASDAALRLLPMSLAIPAAAWSAGRWLQRTGRVLVAQRVGTALVPAALLALGFSGPTGTAARVGLVVAGLGIGLQLPTTLITAQQSVPRSLIGTVTALTSFFRLLGGAVGVAVLSSVVLSLLRGYLPTDAAAPPGSIELALTSRPDSSAPGALPLAVAAMADLAFRRGLQVAAGLALVSTWLVTRLPDVRLLEADSDPVVAAESA